MTPLIGKKLGMTQLFDEQGNQIPVTVILAGPCLVVQKKRREKEGYEAIQLAFDAIPEKKAAQWPKGIRGHFAKKNLPLHRFLKEFRIEAAPYEEGQLLTVSHFKKGDFLDVSGVSKGKGFQGVIKRHHKSGGPASHGSRFHRSTGSIGQRAWPGEVFKNMKLPGHMGDRRVTVRNLEVVQIRPEENLLLVKGAVPGAQNGLLFIRNKTAK